MNIGMSNFAVNSTPAYNQISTSKNIVFKSSVFSDFGDEFVAVSTSPAEKTEEKQPSKINFFRVLFNRLTKEQIDEINSTGQLPKNAKIVNEIGTPKLKWNLLDFTLGTHTMPKGYEFKRDILGFTHVVREDSKAWWLKKEN